MAKLRSKVFNSNSAQDLENSINIYFLQRDVTLEGVSYSVEIRPREGIPRKIDGIPLPTALEYHNCIVLYRDKPDSTG